MNLVVLYCFAFLFRVLSVKIRVNVFKQILYVL